MVRQSDNNSIVTDMDTDKKTDKKANKENVRRGLRARGICVIIPVYNNVGTVGRVVSDVLAYCSDVIVVDDGSDDGTAAVLSSFSDIHVVTLPVNGGKGHALKCGFAKALSLGFSYAVTLDADGQHYASDIPAFLDASIRWPGAVILGNRRRDSIHRSAGSNFANHFSNFWFFVQTGRRLPDTQTGYRLYPLHRLHGFRLMTSRYEAELELIVFASWHGVDIHTVPVDVYYPPEEERVSHFRPAADFTRISILNTLLCVLAVVYGLPLRLWRLLAACLRTMVAVLFFLFASFFVMLPAAWLIMRRPGPSATRRIHKLIYLMSRFVTLRLGVPGAHFSNSIAGSAFERPSVVICNHQSHLDLIYLLSLTPKMVFLTNDRVWHSPFYGYLIHHAEYYPVSMGIDSLLPRLRDLMSRGYSIALFPEGTRSADCRIGRFHRGAFYLAHRLGCGITPVFLYGTGRVLPKHGHVFRKSEVFMEVQKARQCDDSEPLGEQTRFFRHYYQNHFRELCDRLDRLA